MSQKRGIVVSIHLVQQQQQQQQHPIATNTQNLTENPETKLPHGACSGNATRVH